MPDQKPTLGTRTEPAGFPPTEYRPLYGRRPVITEERQPLAMVMLRNLIGTQPKPDVYTVKNGPAFDAVSQLMEESPNALGRVGGIRLKSLTDGTLGQIASTDDDQFGMQITSRPGALKEMFGGMPLVDQLKNVIKHETGHIVGYDEDDARRIAGPETTLPPQFHVKVAPGESDRLLDLEIKRYMDKYNRQASVNAKLRP